jgi:hypothetical protein
METAGTMHTYSAKVWYKDQQTWTLIGAFVYFIIQDQSFLDIIPMVLHPWIDKAIVLIVLWQRFWSVHRPVALTSGQTVEVHSIPPKA